MRHDEMRRFRENIEKTIDFLRAGMYHDTRLAKANHIISRSVSKC